MFGGWSMIYVVHKGGKIFREMVGVIMDWGRRFMDGLWG